MVVCRAASAVLVLLLTIATDRLLVNAQCPCNTTAVWDALKALYDSTDGPRWLRSDRWLETGSTVCDWQGFRNCNDVTLSSNNLRRTLSPALGLLTDSLKHFDVSNNFIVGTLPPEYSSWTNLAGFYVHLNNLTGTLPAEYSSWTYLAEFHVSGNNLTGTLPPQYSGWTSLFTFHVYKNNLSGTLPPQYSAWTELRLIDVGQNNLTGTLPPQYSVWTELLRFDVSGSNLTGTLPPEYSSWTSLDTFYVNGNNLSGTLPQEYSSWTSLHSLRVEVNSLTGTLPPEYSSCTSLDTFYVNGNNLSGTLPPQYSSWTKIVYFHGFQNNLNGTLPPQYGAWGASLRLFVVNNNEFSGTLPSEYSSFTGLSLFAASSNRLTGTLPAAYNLWPSFVSVLLYKNDFTGSLPAAWTGKIFFYLVLHDNVRLSGTIPTRMSIPFYVSLCNTSVCGNIPSAWAVTTWICQDFTPSDMENFATIVLRPVAPALPVCPTTAPPTLAPSIATTAPTAAAPSLSVALTASIGLTTSALGANAVAAVAVTAVGGAGGAAAVGSFMQVSSLSARVNARLRNCGASSPTAASPLEGAAADDEVGSFVGDNPTTLALPGRLSSSGGTVVGNALLLFLAPPVAAGLFYAARRSVAAARRCYRGDDGGAATTTPGRQLLLRLAVRLHLVVYAWVLAPTAAAAAVLLADGAHGGGGAAAAALGVFGLVVAAAPTAAVAVAYLRSRPLKGKVFAATAHKRQQRRSSSSSLLGCGELVRSACADRGSWALLPLHDKPPPPASAARRGRPQAAASGGAGVVVAQLLQHALSETLLGCVYPHGHVFLVDFVLAAAQGVLAGSALSPEAAASCAAVRGLLWTMFAVSVCATAFEAWVRPRATLLDEGIALVMAVWTAVVSLLSALDVGDAVAETTAAQAAASLCCVVLQCVGLHLVRFAAATSTRSKAHGTAAGRPERSTPRHGGSRVSVVSEAPALPRDSADMQLGAPTSCADHLKSLIEQICALQRRRLCDRGTSLRRQACVSLWRSNKNNNKNINNDNNEQR